MSLLKYPLPALVVAMLGAVLPAVPARAEFACPRPLAVIDRWDDTNGNGYYDAGEPFDAWTTGYTASADLGRQMVLQLWNPHAALAPPVYTPVMFPPAGEPTEPQQGGDWLEKWLSECAPYAIEGGDSLKIEPGNMFTTITTQLGAIVDSDPTAYWDENTNSVGGSAFPVTPRLLTIPFFDPSFPPGSANQYLRVSKVASVFLESVSEYAVVTVRFVDAGPATVPAAKSTWGSVKSRFQEPPPGD